MRISHEHRFIFFANPKCGSLSMRKLLFPYSEPSLRSESGGLHRHSRPLEIREFFSQQGWPFEDYRKFCFVRNPWARLVSLYEFRILSRTLHRKIKPGPFLEWLALAEASWGGYERTERTGAGGQLEDNNTELPAYLGDDTRQGSFALDEFIGDGNGGRLVDRVMRLEDIDAELPAYLAELGLPPSEIPRVNTTDHAPYQSYYDDAAIERVGRMYAAEIAEFGYSF